MGSALGAITNGTLLSQIVIYKKPETKKEKKVEWKKLVSNEHEVFW